MADVIKLEPKATYVWVCGCGCSTFELTSNGLSVRAVCANCSLANESASEELAAWYQDEKEVIAGKSKPKTSYKAVRGNGSVEFARHRLVRLAQEESVCGIFVVREDGTMSTWVTATKKKHIKWMKRKLAEIAELIGQVTL